MVHPSFTWLPSLPCFWETASWAQSEANCCSPLAGSSRRRLSGGCKMFIPVGKSPVDSKPSIPSLHQLVPRDPHSRGPGNFFVVGCPMWGPDVPHGCSWKLQLRGDCWPLGIISWKTHSFSYSRDWRFVSLLYGELHLLGYIVEHILGPVIAPLLLDKSYHSFPCTYTPSS